MTSSKMHYMYTCFCGPQETRQNRGDGHQGYIYENCPAKTAPYLGYEWKDLNDFRVPTLLSKIDALIFQLRQSGATKAHLIGSMAQNQSKSSSDIDIVTDIKSNDLNFLRSLASILTEIVGYKVDIVTYSFLDGFPHNALNKASVLIFDDGAS